MKYQIYLNKSTTELVNYLAEQSNLKPNTFIKQLLEDLLKHSLEVTQKLLNEEALDFNELK